MIKKEYKQLLPFDKNKRVVDQFGFLPVSIIKPTKERKEWWKGHGAYLEPEEQRRSDTAEYLPGLGFSEFHAELAEIIVKYWSLPGAHVVDPFAGRATRAIVTSHLKRKYTGYEISPRTFDKLLTVSKDNSLIELHNLTGTMLSKTNDASADLVMTCPPYWNIEKYESTDGQLSDCNTYEDFLADIATTAKNIHRVLKPGAFCCWVCADFRALTGKRKGLLPFHIDTIELFTKAGIVLHDIVIVENVSPFAPLQAGKVAASRYTSKIHEYLVVFRKEGNYEIPEQCGADVMEESITDSLFHYD